MKFTLSLKFVIFRQGDLNELIGKVPPEVWEAKSVVETEFNKLTASGNNMHRSWSTFSYSTYNF